MEYVVWVAVLLACEQEVAALVRVKWHVPLRFPLFQILEIVLLGLRHKQ